MRNSKNIPQKEKLEVQVVGGNPVAAYDCIIAKMANIGSLVSVASKSTGVSSFIVGTTEYAVMLDKLIDVKAEIEKAEAELVRLEGFLAGIDKKLSNERFVSNAPVEVVNLERKKKEDTETKIVVLKTTLENLKK